MNDPDNHHVARAPSSDARAQVWTLSPSVTFGTLTKRVAMFMSMLTAQDRLDG